VRKLEYSLGDTGRAAGLEKNVSFDMMRWTCALRDHRSGMDEEVLRRKLGLSPIQWRETWDRIRKLAEGE
jgi:integrase/recombinase XerD